MTLTATINCQARGQMETAREWWPTPRIGLISLLAGPAYQGTRQAGHKGRYSLRLHTPFVYLRTWIGNASFLLTWIGCVRLGLSVDNHERNRMNKGRWNYPKGIQWKTWVDYKVTPPKDSKLYLLNTPLARPPSLLSISCL